jgi:hypothetical protein
MTIRPRYARLESTTPYRHVSPLFFGNAWVRGTVMSALLYGILLVLGLLGEIAALVTYLYQESRPSAQVQLFW